MGLGLLSGVVKFQMDHAQSTAFNGMAVRDYRRTVAWVVDGRAFEEMTIQTRSFLGKTAIEWNFTKESAQRLAGQIDSGS